MPWKHCRAPYVTVAAPSNAEAFVSCVRLPLGVIQMILMALTFCKGQSGIRAYLSMTRA